MSVFICKDKRPMFKSTSKSIILSQDVYFEIEVENGIFNQMIVTPQAGVVESGSYPSPTEFAKFIRKRSFYGRKLALSIILFDKFLKEGLAKLKFR